MSYHGLAATSNNKGLSDPLVVVAAAGLLQPAPSKAVAYIRHFNLFADFQQNASYLFLQDPRTFTLSRAPGPTNPMPD